MAINEDVEAYLRGLYPPESVEFPPDLTPMPMALEERPRFRNMLEGEVDPVTGETVRPSALQRIRETAEIGAEQNRREADLLAEQAALSLFQGGGMEAAEAPAGERVPLPRGMPQPPPDMGYLDALTQAQRQDDLAASLRRLNDPAEQLARIQSRGIYQPMGLGAAPSAVSQLQQRQQAVADFIRQQREAERAPLELDLLRAQAERQRRPAGGIVETPALKEQREATAAERRASAIAKLRGKPPRFAAPLRPSAAPTKEERITTGLRREFEAQQAVKEFGDVQTSFGKVSEAAMKGTPANDVAMINSFQKMVDPGGVVRDNDFKILATSGAFDDRIALVFKRIASGEKLTNQMRKDFVDAASGQLGVYRKRFDEIATRYEGLAKKSGVAPEDVVFRRKAFTEDAAAPAAEKPAVIETLPEDKRKRLEELRRKRDEGTLGR